MDRLVCHCMVVGEREVLAAIRSGAGTVDEVGERCEAGTGCGSCRGGIEVMLREESARQKRGHAPEALLRQLGLFGDE